MTFTTGESSVLARTIVCPIERMYVIYDFLTGDKLFTHQCREHFRSCEEWVKQQCPWSVNSMKRLHHDNWREWLAAANRSTARHMSFYHCLRVNGSLYDPVAEPSN